MIIANVKAGRSSWATSRASRWGRKDIRKLVRFNGEPAIGLGVVKQSANTLDVAGGARRGGRAAVAAASA
jgi:multidrug efflux pump subunit AcrB